MLCFCSGARNGCSMTMRTCVVMVISFSLKLIGSVFSFCRWRKSGSVGLGIASLTVTNVCGIALGLAFTFPSRLGYCVSFGFANSTATYVCGRALGLAANVVSRLVCRVSFGLASSTVTNVCGRAFGLAANFVNWVGTVVTVGFVLSMSWLG